MKKKTSQMLFHSIVKYQEKNGIETLFYSTTLHSISFHLKYPKIAQCHVWIGRNSSETNDTIKKMIPMKTR